MTQRHKVFVSYYHDDDQQYRNKFESICSDVIASRSVREGDINTNLKTETIRQKIRDEYLRDSTVTVVLIGNRTWQRKHVDWEIGSSLRHTQHNARSGLIGIILPTYNRPEPGKYRPTTVPPRLYDNIGCKYSKIYGWSTDPNEIQDWIHEAYIRKDKVNPDNSREQYVNNRSGSSWS